MVHFTYRLSVALSHFPPSVSDLEQCSYSNKTYSNGWEWGRKKKKKNPRSFFSVRNIRWTVRNEVEIKWSVRIVEMNYILSQAPIIPNWVVYIENRSGKNLVDAIKGKTLQSVRFILFTLWNFSLHSQWLTQFSKPLCHIHHQRRLGLFNIW